MPTHLDRFFRSRILSRVFATPRGRAFFLAHMADAEESDERGVFDTLLARVDDPELRALVRKHVDDEDRHAKILRACAERQGVPAPPIPRALRVVPRVDAKAGGLADEFVAGRLGVMEAYALLQVIEERAVREFPAVADALEPFDPESARVVREVWRDEKRHVLYAQAIGKRYAPRAVDHERTLARYRRAEAEAFLEHRRAMLHAMIEHRVLGRGWAERLVWRTLAGPRLAA